MLKLKKEMGKGIKGSWFWWIFFCWFDPFWKI